MGVDLEFNCFRMGSMAFSMEFGWIFTAFAMDLNGVSIDSHWMFKGSRKEFQLLFNGCSKDLGKL